MLTIFILIATFIGVAALVGGVAVVLRGGSSGEMETRLDVLTGAAKPSDLKKRSKEATVLTEPLDVGPGAIEEFLSRFGNVRLLLSQADISTPPSKFFLICGGLGGLGAGLCAAFGVHFALIPVVGVSLALLPLAWAVFRRRRRLSAFGKQLPNALELVARALRAGHSLAAGFQLVGSEMADPIGKEFAQVYEEQNLGIPLEEAINLMTDRVPNVDLRFFATAIILQRQTGGDLAEILDKIGRLIRDRFKIFGQIQALTGEGRLSGIVLLALCPALFAVMFKLNPSYVMILFEDPLGRQMLAVAIFLQVVGALVIKKIVNIKV